MPLEVVERDGVRYAEVLRADARVPVTRFFSPADSSMQFGLLAHEAGFYEPPHTHETIERTIRDCQQMLVVQRGALVVEFFTQGGGKFHEVELTAGDAILLVHGPHAVRVTQDMQCVSVKQGPFLGPEHDKIGLRTQSA